MEVRCCKMQGERSEMPDNEKGEMLLSAKGHQALPTPEARGGAGPRLSPAENIVLPTLVSHDQVPERKADASDVAGGTVRGTL